MRSHLMSAPDITVHYRDAEIVVAEKPGGLLSVPGRGPEKQDCVVKRLRRIIPEMIQQPAVHRLDMYTSGLMVLGITAEAHRSLSMQFEARAVEKQYIAVVEGCVTDDFGRVELCFRLDPNNRPRQIYDPIQGKLGITEWKCIARSETSSRIQLFPHTGRTHQLRLHAVHPLGLNCPIVGDSLYGNGNDGDRMCLHASVLSFAHPVTGVKMDFSSPPPF